MSRRRDSLPHLHIAPPLHMQQPGPALYSPALPTSIQQGFYPPMPMPNPAGMQTFLMNQQRPTHRGGQASIAQLAAMGIHPPTLVPNGGPMTPMSGHFPRPSLMGLPNNGIPPGGHPFPNRNRRQLSIGGPPKAVLGGPARKLSPLPGAVSSSSPVPTKRKVVVNLPKESIAGDNGGPSTRPEWARNPLPMSEVNDAKVDPPETVSCEMVPPEEFRDYLPASIDVFLPGRQSWDVLKEQAFTEKMERLGVEHSSIPQIHAPHARAASISSPADPALLLFKLNKLQQSQLSASAENSLSTSPQPPLFTPSPNSQLRMYTNRHGHSMSLAQPPSYYGSDLNPFGPTATLGFDEISLPSRSPLRSPAANIVAPQGRVPLIIPTMAQSEPLSAVGLSDNNRPDFTLGFGLDIPEESEEELEEENRIENLVPKVETSFVTNDEDADTEEGPEMDEEPDQDGLLTALHSRHHSTHESSRLSPHHSRHESRLSAALSLRSFGGLVADGLKERTDVGPIHGLSSRHRDDLTEGVEEWTGSEDVFISPSDVSDDESIGDWSNPSDEERARQARAEKRIRRRQGREQPRRLPNFPRPPDNRHMLSSQNDDIISNPSEEEHIRASRDLLAHEQYHRPASNTSSRPLPPLPHSRATSGQHSVHDPAHAHSRNASDHFSGGFPESKPSLRSSGSLNPFAKPFVFGAARYITPVLAQPQSQPPVHAHTRTASQGKMLNAAAQEFTPGGFTFTFANPNPAPVFPIPEHRPLPIPPDASSSPFKVQGREKRQRRDSTGSVHDEGDSMASFKFPVSAQGSPQKSRKEAIVDSPEIGTVNSFTFAGFSAAAGLPPIPPAESSDATYNESTAKAELGDSRMTDFTFPSPVKQKRAPIPLDFKHPISRNTVPAGLFKALINGGDERTRRTVRSRLSSHELFDYSRRPSLDDLDVQPISLAHKISRSRLVTDPGIRPRNEEGSPNDDVFGPSLPAHVRRRSSLPENLHRSSGSSMSDASIHAAPNYTTRMELSRVEDALEKLLDDKMESFREVVEGGQRMHPKTEAMITEVVSLFRTQLQESAVKGFEDSQMDARGELDFEMIREIVEQGQIEIAEVIRREIRNVAPRDSASASGDLSSMEHYTARTISAVVEAISELSTRMESIGQAAPAREQDAIVDAVISSLVPILSAHSQPVDYDFLAERLSQAVRPNISQLIDLTSDKKETADLITDRLLPVLSSLMQTTPPIDIEALTVRLTSEVRRAIGPIDAFEIKEQVADLVIERLDSRLAVRDKAFNADSLAQKVSNLLVEPFNGVGTNISSLLDGQRSLITQQSELTSSHKTVLDLLVDIPAKISSALDALRTTQFELQANSSSGSSDANIIHIKSAVDGLTTTQQSLTEYSTQLIQLHEDVLRKLNSLPENFNAATVVLQSAHAEFTLSRDAYKRELDDMRRTNTESQVQIAKARGAHGQMRVEKDMLGEKLNIVEADRERLRSQVHDLQASSSVITEEVKKMAAQNAELNEGLSKALNGLHLSDISTKTARERAVELEQANRDLMSERQTLKAKVDSLDLQVTFAARDKQAAEKTLTTLQQQYDYLSAQQSHWEALRHTAEQVDLLATMMGQVDREELHDLRRSRDRSKVLEGEHAALQRRYKEQDTKLMNLERASVNSRQTVTQAQQRASEWERRAKDAEAEVERMKSMIDGLEQSHSELEHGFSLAKLQLEEKEVDERSAKDRETKLRDTVAAFETKVNHMQVEIQRAAIARVNAMTNGNGHVSRPTSGMSAYSTMDGSVTPPVSVGVSVRDSKIRLPGLANGIVPKGRSIATPTSRYPSTSGRTTPQAHPYSRVSPPSPTPSTISVAPTVDGEGWWSI